MNESASTKLAAYEQANKSNTKKELSLELKARRDAVWQGERLVLETHFAESRIMHSIGYLGIADSGVSVLFLTNLMRNLTRFNDNNGLLKGKVLVDLRESRFDSNATLAKVLGVSLSSIKAATMWLIERDFLRSTGKQGKLKREYAFGGAFLDRVTGSATAAKKTKAMPTKGFKKQTCKSSVAAKQDKSPLDELLESPLDGQLVLEDLVPQKELKPNPNTARNPEEVCLRQPGLFIVGSLKVKAENKKDTDSEPQKRPLISKRVLAGALSSLYGGFKPIQVYEAAIEKLLRLGSRERIYDQIELVRKDSDSLYNWNKESDKAWHDIMIAGYKPKKPESPIVEESDFDHYEQEEEISQIMEESLIKVQTIADTKAALRKKLIKSVKSFEYDVFIKAIETTGQMTTWQKRQIIEKGNNHIAVLKCAEADLKFALVLNQALIILGQDPIAVEAHNYHYSQD